MNARRFNNNFRGRNKPKFQNNRFSNKNNNKSNNNQLIMRNIPKNVIRDIIRTNLPYDRQPRRRNYRNNRNSNNMNRRTNKRINYIAKSMITSPIPATNFNIINNKKTKKEARTDKLKTPMSMVLSGHFIPIYRISERCIINYTYTKIRINVTSNSTRAVSILFPYSINFNPELYDYIDDKVVVQQNLNCNTFYNILHAQYGNNRQYEAYHTSRTGIIGNWKLIGTSYKIYNVTSRMYVGGNVTVTKVVDNKMCPYFYPAVSDVNQHLAAYLEDYTNKSYDLVQPKNSFGPTDIIRIDEFNTSDGTNIFQSPTEYLGCKYTSNPEGDYPNFTNDLVGNNTKYVVEYIPGSNTQTYIIEIWNVFAVIPSPRSGMGNVVKAYDFAFDKGVVDQMKTRTPMYSTKKM